MVSRKALDGFLKRNHRIGIDSNILIYQIEGHPEYRRPAQKIFAAIEAGHNIGICSTLSLLEVLVQPYRNDDDSRVNQFYALLTTYPNLTWTDLSIEIADLGARLRAKYRIRTPDAIVLATAIHAGASGFIGNDARMRRITETEVMVLS